MQAHTRTVPAHRAALIARSRANSIYVCEEKRRKEDRNSSVFDFSGDDNGKVNALSPPLPLSRFVRLHKGYYDFNCEHSVAHAIALPL